MDPRSQRRRRRFAAVRHSPSRGAVTALRGRTVDLASVGDAGRGGRAAGVQEGRAKEPWGPPEARDDCASLVVVVAALNQGHRRARQHAQRTATHKTESKRRDTTRAGLRPKRPPAVLSTPLVVVIVVVSIVVSATVLLAAIAITITISGVSAPRATPAPHQAWLRPLPAARCPERIHHPGRLCEGPQLPAQRPQQPRPDPLRARPSRG